LWDSRALTDAAIHSLLFNNLNYKLQYSLSHPYFPTTEKSIMKKKEERDLDLTVTRSREELEQQVLVKMKSVTGAEDEVCVAMLESNGYDLKTSIEAFFQSK